MVTGKVKSAMGLQKSPANPKPSNSTSGKQASKSSGGSLTRSFGAYFPRASAQVQPRPPDVTELLRLVEELRERESRLKTELLELKLLRESAAIVPVLENEISKRDYEIERSSIKIDCLETENERLREDNCLLHEELAKQNCKYEDKIKRMQGELLEIKRAVLEREQEEAASSSSSPSIAPKLLIDVTNTANNNNNKSSLSSAKCLKKSVTANASSYSLHLNNLKMNETTESIMKKDDFSSRNSFSNSEDHLETSEALMAIRSRTPRIPKPPPKPSISSSSSLALSSCLSSPSCSSLSESADRALSSPLPPPPPPPIRTKIPSPPPPPPSKSAAPVAPPPPPKGLKPVATKVRRVPEVVEFYHSLMRRDSTCRRDSGGGAAVGAAAKDMIGEIENRSAHLLAIKTDVETQGDFIRSLIKEVEGSSFTNIEDVVPFVKWLDDELSYLVDERAVLKHFDWPEQKADALREAAFGYGDLKKLECEVSSFHDDPRQPCGSALKKMQSLFEKLEHGAYNLSRMRESASNRYKVFQIPMNWMLDTGYVSQIKLASVKLAMKYMKRVLAELEMVVGGPEEEELIVQGVKFAFRVHQFAGGFDVETMKAFQELRDKIQLCNIQCQTQQQKYVCRSSSAC